MKCSTITCGEVSRQPRCRSGASEYAAVSALRAAGNGIDFQTILGRGGARAPAAAAAAIRAASAKETRARTTGDRVDARRGTFPQPRARAWAEAPAGQGRKLASWSSIVVPMGASDPRRQRRAGRARGRGSGRPGRARGRRRPRRSAGVAAAARRRSREAALGLRALARVPRLGVGDRRQPLLLRDRRLRALRALLVPADLHVPALDPDAADGARERPPGGPLPAAAADRRRRARRLPHARRARRRRADGGLLGLRAGRLRDAVDRRVRLHDDPDPHAHRFRPRPRVPALRVLRPGPDRPRRCDMPSQRQSKRQSPRAAGRARQRPRGCRAPPASAAPAGVAEGAR